MAKTCCLRLLNFVQKFYFDLAFNTVTRTTIDCREITQLLLSEWWKLSLWMSSIVGKWHTNETAFGFLLLEKMSNSTNSWIFFMSHLFVLYPMGAFSMPFVLKRHRIYHVIWVNKRWLHDVLSYRLTYTYFVLIFISNNSRYTFISNFIASYSHNRTLTLTYLHRFF